jgi:hypothetical protein
MNRELQDVKEQLAAMIVSLGGELHVQIQQMETRISERFDRIEARLDRQGGLIRAGSIWTDRMTRWSERMDVVLSKMDARLRKLEDKSSARNTPSPPESKE